MKALRHEPFISVQFSSRWYLCARKSAYVLHSVSQKCPLRYLGNSSNVRLTDDGPLSSLQGRSSSASSFHASLLQEIDGVMSVALCPIFVRVSRMVEEDRSNLVLSTRLS